MGNKLPKNMLNFLIFMGLFCFILFLIYIRYAGHEQYHYNTQQGIDAMKEMHQKILEFSKNLDILNINY